MRNFLFTALLAASSAALVDLHHTTHIPAGWRATPERVSGDAVFHNVMVGLKRSNTAKLSQLVAEVSDPKGASYLNYPSYEALGDMVRPQAEHTAAVKAWVAKHGASIVSEHPHGDYLTLQATAAQLEEMSNGKFTTYVHAASGMKVHRITGGVRVPEAVAEAVDTFSGFDGFPLEPKPVKEQMARGQMEAPVPTPAPSCPLTPSTLRSTYNTTHVPKSGKTNIQAIASFTNEYVNDEGLATFCKKYDPVSAPCSIQKFIGGNNQSESGIEAMLDVEYVVTMSQNAATWVYSYPGSDFCTDLVNFGANVTSEAVHPYVISISYATQMIDYCPQALMNRFASDVEKMGALGITVMVSSGDDGSGHTTRMGVNAGKMSPAYPASIPHAVAVGATYFINGTSGLQEATTSFGSGGGFSYAFAAPSYQTAAISSYLDTVEIPKTYAYAKGGRGSPDVAGLGEQFSQWWNDELLCAGGTSASSPSFAALVTLLNEVCLAEGGKSLGFANPLFYQNPGMFTDVMHGTNAVGENKEGWAAIKGWDAATGLGTPNFPAMVKVVQKACRK